MHVTDHRPESRYYLIDRIPTVNLGVSTLNTGDNAWNLIAFFFAGLTQLAEISPVRVVTGRCTCCTPARLAYRFGDEREEWGHFDDHHYAEMRHIHIDSSSSDCDGRYTRGHVTRLNSGIAPWALRPSIAANPDETPTWQDLVNYVFTDVTIWSGPTSIDVDTDAGYMRWSTSTDEGGVAGEARICADPYCAYEDDVYRDHRAESMGY